MSMVRHDVYYWESASFAFRHDVYYWESASFADRLLLE